MSGQTHFRFPALQFCLSGAEFQAQAPGPGQEKCVFGFPQVSTKTQRKITQMAVCQNLVPLVNIKIAGKWMFIPLKMVLIGIDPYPYKPPLIWFFPISSYGFSHEKPRDFPIKNTMIRDPSQVPRSVVIHPTVASMATRPCFSSAWSELLGNLGVTKPGG